MALAALGNFLGEVYTIFGPRTSPRCVCEFLKPIIAIPFPVNMDQFTQAALHGRVNEFRWLKNLRVSDINGSDSGGWSVLMAASQNGHLDIAEEILQENTVRIDQVHPLNGRTALMQASRNGHTSLVNLFLDRTARINNTDNDGWSSLMLAAWKGNEQVVRTLIRRGADKTITNNHGQTAHAIAVESGHAQIAQLLVV